VNDEGAAQEPIEQRDGDGGVVEDVTPVRDASVRASHIHPASIPRSSPFALVRRRSRAARDLHMLFADVRRQPPLPPSQAKNASSILVARSFANVR
jgi:hypothetical protein